MIFGLAGHASHSPGGRVGKVTTHCLGPLSYSPLHPSLKNQSPNAFLICFYFITKARDLYQWEHGNNDGCLKQRVLKLCRLQKGEKPSKGQRGDPEINHSKKLLPRPQDGRTKKGDGVFRSRIWGHPEEMEPQEGCLVTSEPQERHSHCLRPCPRGRHGGNTPASPFLLPFGLPAGPPTD